MSFRWFRTAFLLTAMLTAFGQSGAVRIAGLDPSSTSVGDGGPATLARLEYPTSVAVDTSGNLYIADEGLLRIRKVGTDGTISTIAGTGAFQSGADGGPAVSTPVVPYGVAVDSRGTVYFSDSRVLVRKIAADGTLVTVAGFSGAGTGGGDGGPATAAKIAPWGIAIDRSNNVYIADANAAVVRKVTPDGIIHTVAGTGQSGAQGEGGPAAAGAAASAALPGRGHGGQPLYRRSKPDPARDGRRNSDADRRRRDDPSGWGAGHVVAGHDQRHRGGQPGKCVHGGFDGQHDSQDRYRRNHTYHRRNGTAGCFGRLRQRAGRAVLRAGRRGGGCGGQRVYGRARQPAGSTGERGRLDSHGGGAGHCVLRRRRRSGYAGGDELAGGAGVRCGGNAVRGRHDQQSHPRDHARGHHHDGGGERSDGRRFFGMRGAAGAVERSCRGGRGRERRDLHCRHGQQSRDGGEQGAGAQRVRGDRGEGEFGGWRRGHGRDVECAGGRGGGFRRERVHRRHGQ